MPGTTVGRISTALTCQMFVNCFSVSDFELIAYSTMCSIRNIVSIWRCLLLTHVISTGNHWVLVCIPCWTFNWNSVVKSHQWCHYVCIWPTYDRFCLLPFQHIWHHQSWDTSWAHLSRLRHSRQCFQLAVLFCFWSEAALQSYVGSSTGCQFTNELHTGWRLTAKK